MFKKIFFIAIIFAMLFFSGCVKQKSQVCGDGKCESKESIETCQVDCKKIDQNQPKIDQNLPEIDKNQPVFENNKLPALGVFSLRPTEKFNFIKWARYQMSWNIIEPSKGNFKFKDFDALAETGLNAVVTLRFNAMWAKNCVDSNSANGSFASSPKSCAPEKEQDLRDFVKTVAERYSCKNFYWQIENEAFGPNSPYWIGTMDDLVKVTKIASEEILKGDKCSSGKIVLAGIDSNPPKKNIKIVESNFLKVLSNAKDSFDIVDIHLYNETQSIEMKLGLLKKLMKESGNDGKPIFATESAYFFFGQPDKATPELQALDIPKRDTIEFSNGIILPIQVLYKDAGANSVDSCTAKCGLLDENDKPKPAYYAFRQFAGKISGFKKVEKLESPNGTSVYKYDNGTIIAWAEENGTHDLSQTLNSENVELEKIALTENLLEKEAVSAKKIPLTTDALYITISG